MKTSFLLLWEQYLPSRCNGNLFLYVLPRNHYLLWLLRRSLLSNRSSIVDRVTRFFFLVPYLNALRNPSLYIKCLSVFEFYTFLHLCISSYEIWRDGGALPWKVLDIWSGANPVYFPFMSLQEEGIGIMTTVASLPGCRCKHKLSSLIARSITTFCFL
jgi:hypothetical protein